ncbi:MAG TPA: S8 family peptidase [Terriglobales bacterium]|nr:S8 family peptidase [Terriglobales bacterium]
MKPQTTTKGAVARFWRLHLVAAMLLLTFVSTAFAAPGKHGPKAAPDLDRFLVNPDGTVDVIVQFKPDAFEDDKNFHPNDKFYSGPHGDRMKQAAIEARSHFKASERSKFERNFGVQFKREFGAVSGASVRISVNMLERLLQDDKVLYVSPDRPNKSAWDDAPQPVNDAIARQNYGVDGTGIGIAVIDSGVYQHDDLQTADMTNSRVVYSESFVPGDASTNDAYGHGTHVAGIVAGNGHDSAGRFYGIAPKANIINLRVLDANGGGSDSQVIAAINRAIQLKNQYNIRVINLSLGRPVFESYTLDPLCQAVEAAWKAGIVVVTAAGNMGRDNSFGEQGYATIEAPGNDPNVITVGAMSPQGTWTRTDDIVASYSSKGPSLLDHILKPDIMAPGNKITSLLSPGSTLSGLAPLSAIIKPTQLTWLCDVFAGQSDCGATSPGPQYMQLSGTSMATPVVAGGAALMIQSNPNITPDMVKARMMRSAWKGYPVRGNSWGRDVRGNTYLSQYDVFTIGAGYLDIQAALGDNSPVNGGAASPTVVFNPLTKTATLVNGMSVVWGQSMVWGQSGVFANSVVWGQLEVDASSMVWGNSVVWGQTDEAACSMVWGQSVVWGQLDDGTLNALSDGDPGDASDADSTDSGGTITDGEAVNPPTGGAL